MKKEKLPFRAKPTKEQLRVIECEDPVISLRGYHGTGKTKTAAEFAIHRLQAERKCRVLVVTLTKRAAVNFADWLYETPDWEPYFNRRVRVGTFHSFAQSYVRKFASRIGFTSLFSLDNDINSKVLNDIVKDKNIDLSENPAKDLNDLYKMHVRSAKGIKSTVQQHIKKRKDQKGVIKILKRMHRQKKKMNVMDHDDTLYYFRRLLKKEVRVVNAVLRDFTHMVVDEFQDTTNVQWQTMEMLIRAGMRFLGAGDPCQTLFRYTGASLYRFNELESIDGCRKFELTENHRTTKHIVALANAVLSQHSPDNANRIWSKKDGPKPQVLLNPNMGLLCKAIVEKVRLHIQNDGLSLNDVLVTFRNDSVTNYFRKMLNKMKLPYVYHSKTAIDIPEVVAVVTSILEASLDNGNKAQWKGLLPYLSGIGVQKTERILKTLAGDKYRYQELRTIYEEMDMVDLGKLYKLFLRVNLSKDKPLRSVKMMLNFLKGLKKRMPGIEIHSKQLIMTAEKSIDTADLIDNLKQHSFGQYYIPKRHQRTDNFLTLGNVHQIKGQEFKVVFILGSYDTFFETHNSFENEDSITDELLIMHTAITRSRRYLYILLPMTHFDWAGKRHPINSSIFIRNCASELYETLSVEPD